MNTSITGLRVTTDGEVSPVTIPYLEERGIASLERMYELIDCRIVECVTLWESIDMWADEEGLLTGSPLLNPLATTLASVSSRFFRPIVGNVLILGSNEVTGDTLSLDMPALLSHCQRPPLSDWLPELEHAIRVAAVPTS